MRKNALNKNTAETGEHIKFSVLAADVAIMSLRDGQLVVRLMDVDRPPYFVHQPGLPGGLVLPSETAKETARRLVEEKGVLSSRKCYLEQLQTYSALERDPRGRVVSVAYIALVPWSALSTTEQAGTDKAWWECVDKGRTLRLAYDHNEILRDAVARLQSKLRYTTIASSLLAAEFTLFELRTLYEKILDVPIDKRNFIKKINATGVIEPTGRKETGRKARPAELYRFTSKKIATTNIL